MLKTLAIRASILALMGSMSVAAYAVADGVKTVNIPAGDLRTALETFAKQSGTDLVFRPEQVEGLKTRGVQGELPALEAVARLLEGTPLKLSISEKGAMLIAAPMESEKPTADAAHSVEARWSDAPESAETSQTTPVEKDGFWKRWRLAQAESTSTTASTVDEGAKLDEVLVTAQKRKENVKEVPISISVLGGQELDNSTIPSVGEALRRFPGIDLNSSLLTGNSINLSIRGVSSGASQFLSGPSTAAFYVDSVPFGLIRNSFLPDPSVYDLERVEVLRGPQGTLYGANALNGLVRVLTHDPDLDTFGFKARLTDSGTSGGKNNYRADAAFNIPLIEGKLALRATVGYQRDGGWIDSDREKNLNDTTLKNYRLKLAAKPTDSLSIGLSAWRSEGSFMHGGFSDKNAHITTAIDDPSDTHFDAYGLKVENDFGAFTATSMTSYFKYRNTAILDAHPLFIPLALLPDFRSKIFTEELDLVSNTSGPWRWSAGLFFRDAKDPYFESETLYPPFTPVVTTGLVVADFYDRSKSAAIYGEVARQLTDRFELSVGLRYFHDNETQQATGDITGAPPGPAEPFKQKSHAVTPRVVLTWKPGTDQMIYASYAQGFRSGLAQAQLVTVLYPDIPPVKPDRLNNYEVGIKGDTLDRRLSYEGAIFYIDWKDIQQNLNVDLGGGLNTNALVNGVSASGVGAELAITARPVTGLDLTVSGSWNELEQDEAVISGGFLIKNKGDRLDFSPKYTLGGSATYEFPLGGTGYKSRFSIGGNYRAAQLAVNNLTGTTPSEPTFSSQASLAVFAPSHWNANLFVENLTNDYRSPTPPPALAGAFEEWRVRQRPRTIGVQVEYEF